MMFSTFKKKVYKFISEIQKIRVSATTWWMKCMFPIWIQSHFACLDRPALATLPAVCNLQSLHANVQVS